MNGNPLRWVFIIDAHVHIYECFALENLLDAAYGNFKREAARHGKIDSFTGVLLLAETSSDHWFRRLRSYAERVKGVGKPAAGMWRFTMLDDCSISVQRSSGESLIVVAGRQIATSENLEVLALATDKIFSDGVPMRDVVELATDYGAIPVIPWGAGKWLGRRGALLKEFLEQTSASAIFLGDNSGRPYFWRNPRHFKLARGKGIRILPGSDPLPFPSEFWRPGSFGFTVPAIITLDHPATNLKAILRDPSMIPEPYGSPERLDRFCRNQLAMQLRKRI
jgi:hypothetical protein